MIPVESGSSRGPYLRVYAEEEDDGGYDLFADSFHIIDLHLQLTFTRLERLACEATLPFECMIPAGSRGEHLLSLRPSGKGRRSYILKYTFTRGNPATVRHDEEHLYLFPFEHGVKHCVTQGFHGKFTHEEENEYALDFDLDEGSVVCAARAGTVAEVCADHTMGGVGSLYDRYANYILVEHSDGSFGNYAHLRYGGALVRPGQRVDAGQPVGISGNTGRTSGPHLHFDVRVPSVNGRMQTLPVRFLGPPAFYNVHAQGHDEGSDSLPSLHLGTGAPSSIAAGTTSSVRQSGGHRTRQNSQEEPPSRPASVRSRFHSAAKDPQHGARTEPAVIPVESHYYYSYHPGLPQFDVVLGSDLTPGHFDGYVKKVRLNGKVELRIERRDLTYLIFVRNGMSTGATVRVTMSLHGMSSTAGLPVQLDTPAETELFVTLLRPNGSASRYGYSYRLQVTTKA